MGPSENPFFIKESDPQNNKNDISQNNILNTSSENLSNKLIMKQQFNNKINRDIQKSNNPDDTFNEQF